MSKCREAGYVNIPGWFFLFAPIGAVLVVFELVRFLLWLYEHVEVTIK